jgi:hypothetical protein
MMVCLFCFVGVALFFVFLKPLSREFIVLALNAFITEQMILVLYTFASHFLLSFSRWGFWKPTKIKLFGSIF